jgi:hypothetical protein
MINPMKEVLYFLCALSGVEHFERGFALQHLRRTPKPTRRLILGSEGLLRGSKNPNYAHEPVRLLWRKSANLAPMA